MYSIWFCSFGDDAAYASSSGADFAAHETDGWSHGFHAFDFAAHADPSDSSFWEFDKKEHFTVNFIISSAGYVFLRKHDLGRWESLVTSVAFSALISTAKEVHDREVDPKDIQADFVGALLGGGICFTVDLAFF